jgi:hypothetical protein
MKPLALALVTVILVSSSGCAMGRQGDRSTRNTLLAGGGILSVAGAVMIGTKILVRDA